MKVISGKSSITQKCTSHKTSKGRTRGSNAPPHEISWGSRRKLAAVTNKQKQKVKRVWMSEETCQHWFLFFSGNWRCYFKFQSTAVCQLTLASGARIIHGNLRSLKTWKTLSSSNVVWMKKKQSDPFLYLENDLVWHHVCDWCHRSNRINKLCVSLHSQPCFYEIRSHEVHVKGRDSGSVYAVGPKFKNTEPW